MGVSGSSYFFASTSNRQPRPVPFVAEERDVSRLEPVCLFVYDLAEGWAGFLSTVFARFHVEAVWHTSIVVFNKEYSFGMAGIQVEEPGVPERIISLGTTRLSERALYEILAELENGEYHHSNYNPFERNCHRFSDQLCELLTNRRIPREYTTLGERIARLIRIHYSRWPPALLASGSDSAGHLQQ